MKATGTYIETSTAGESFKAFVPNPLPLEPVPAENSICKHL